MARRKPTVTGTIRTKMLEPIWSQPHASVTNSASVANVTTPISFVVRRKRAHAVRRLVI
jgi:hypothetical protein